MSRIRRFLKSDTSTIYHVMSRTALDGYPLSDVGKDVLLGLIRKYSRFYMVDVLGFALMGNHFHLAVRMHSDSKVSDDDVRKRMEAWYTDRKFFSPNAIARHKKMLTSLSHYMKSLKQAFTRYYNKTHNRRGFFWGDRFKSVIVKDGPTLVNLLAYIDLNPVRAGLVEKPEDYRWNTLGHHMGTGNPDGFLSTDFGMKEWNEHDPAERLLKYREFVYETGALDTGKGKVMDSALVQAERMKKFLLTRAQRFKYRTRYFTDSGIIGSKAFVQEVFDGVKHLLGSKDERRFTPVAGVKGVYSMKKLQGCGQMH